MDTPAAHRVAVPAMPKHDKVSTTTMNVKVWVHRSKRLMARKLMDEGSPSKFCTARIAQGLLTSD